MDRPWHSSAEGLRAIRLDQQDKDGKQSHVRPIITADAATAIDVLLTTDAPFRERLVWFWANHFTVSLRRGQVTALAHAYLREAIRPHVTGRFEDMLVAVMRHPAMLIYLDNAQSFGPNSNAGMRARRGLNENLARECLELHTVTPASGYTQNDVTEFAKVLTGWSVRYEEEPPGYLFRLNAHELGSKTVMGQVYAGGEGEGMRALGWLAEQPSTYRNLAIKLVRHFVADVPPPGAVARVERALNQTKGNLKAAALEVVALPDAWTPLTKLRRPMDYVVGVLRALDLPQGRRPDLRGVFGMLGQPYLSAPLPNGWSDLAEDWAAPEALLRRIDWAYSIAGRAGDADPVAIADASLGELLPADTMSAIRRAGDRREALTLLLAAPEFQRR
ncbi:MAG: DUF1800 domain-containing protein [Acetobacteraceae bacterium]|nr:DUF1800 domain-containing protein [Acetobacteraceae bacterium]